MGMQLILIVLKLCIVHGSAGYSISPSPANFSVVPPIEEGTPSFSDHGKSLNISIPNASPPPNGIVSHSPIVPPPHIYAPIRQTIQGIVPSMPPGPLVVVPSQKAAPLAQKMPGIVPSMPQSTSHKRAPDVQSPATVPHVQVPIASPPRKIPEKPLAMNPSMPGVAPSTLSEHAVSPISTPPPSTSRKEYGKPAAAPPKETSMNDSPTKEHAVYPILTPPPSTSRKEYEKPVATPPKETFEQLPPMNQSPSKEHAVSPISTPPPSTSRKEYGMPLAAPPKQTFDQLSPVNHSPTKEHVASPILTPPPSTSRKEYEMPLAAPPKQAFDQLSPIDHSPTKEHVVSPISTPPHSTSRKKFGMPVAAPPKHTFDHLSPMNHSPTKDPFPVVSPASHKATRPPSNIVIAPSISPPKHTKRRWVHSPASSPSISFNKDHHARKRVITPALAPSYSAVPPTSYHKGPVIPPAPSYPSTVTPKKSPVIHPAPSHPPTMAPKQSRPRHRHPPPLNHAPSHLPTMAPKQSRPRHLHPPPLNHGPVSPIQPPFPSTVTQGSPAPSPSSTISSARTQKGPILPPLISPLASSPRNPKTSPPPAAQVLPPPPPNQDCTSLTCSDPLTNSPPGAPCVCVLPIQVELRLGVALYTFFPLVSELAAEIANGVFMKQSQVRIMGANAATEQLEKTIVLIDLVPLGESFDNTTAFLTYEKFWHNQVAIKTSFFGDYEVLYVHYPGLPPSPPSAPSSITIIDGVPYTRHGNNARTIHPLGVDVRKKQERGLAGSIIAIIVLSSFAAMVLCIGAAWLLLIKCRDHTHLAETPQTFGPSLGKQPRAGGSLLFGSGISSTSLSFGSSITTYTGSAKTFTADEIERATNNFDESRILGEGGFGRVYKGILEDEKEVAVKVLKRDDQQGGREFLAEVEMLGRLHHRNLVKLIGICIEDHARCLVYELIPNGSVESHLHGVDKGTAPLDWGARIKIALGAARGLAYLHEDSSPHVIHRDFKSSNILLEHDFTPKVSDFGLARTAFDEGNKHISTRVMGTFGYVAPEYAMTGHLLVKSDVYSYGVVLLELLTGRKPVDMSQPQGQENLVAWARPLLTSKEGLEMIIDPALGSNFPFDSVAKVAAIASMCVQPEVSHRPFMGEVVQALKLVCNECDESKEAGSDCCSQEYLSVVDIDTRTNTGSGHLLGTSRTHCSDYESSLEGERALSASEIFGTSTNLGRQASGSFRRHSSSGPLRTGRSRQFWQRVRSLSRGSVSEHGDTFRLWAGSR